MKKICLIICYFGKLPNYFELWLNSCKYNNTIDFILFTDDKTKYEVPSNVKIVYKTFEQIKKEIQSKFDFKISLEKPYKLCDYKVAYGDIFYDDIKEYNFWGHCDLDTIWGDIRKYITDEVLDKYDKILPRGHFSLYRNTKEVNSRYKQNLNGIELYKEVFSTDKSYAFDEWEGLYKIYKIYGYPIYEEEIIADISVKYKNLCINSNKQNAIFSWNVEENKSKIYSYTFNKTIIKDEYMYIHLQKRRMKIKEPYEKFMTEFLILPNEFKSEKIKNIDKKYIQKYTKFKIVRMEYTKMRIKNYWSKLKK